jgi:hypothetical protein
MAPDGKPLRRLLGRAAKAVAVGVRRQATPAPCYFGAMQIATAGPAFGSAALDADGRLVWSLELHARGHVATLSADAAICALVDRKPGATITLCDPRNGALRSRIAAPPGCSFDGHAVIDAEGALLYATASRDGDQQGRICVYRLADGAAVAEFPTHGIDPHELIWVGANRLAVANGGIKDRRLAEAEIESSLAILDAKTGALQSLLRLEPALNSLSIRHLAAGAGGEILFAMQDQDAATARRPMVGLLDAAGALEFLAPPADILARLRGYCGSVAVDDSQEIAGVTSPHGGVAVFWSIADRRCLGIAELRDGCGIAAAPGRGRFLFTAGTGACLLVEASGDGVLSRALASPGANALRWDNHLTALASRPEVQYPRLGST